MKPHPLHALTIGLDVVSGETALPDGAVRRAHNITIQNNGDFQRRAGYTALFGLVGAHSFWQSPAQTRVLAAAGSTLYDVDLANAGAAALFGALNFDMPIEYTDVGPDIYFTGGGVLRKIDPLGVIRRPGILNLLGQMPALATTVGSMLAGRYGVAYSVVNDLGEESPVSSPAFIDVAAGGILVSGIQTATDVTRMNIYVTPRNGDDLRRYANLPIAASASILDNRLDRKSAEKLGCQMMPGGEYVRYFNGRLYVIDGKWVYCSRNLDYGVSNTEGDWMTFNRTITMWEPVRDGIFVGMREKTIFLRGNGPKDFQSIDLASAHGAFAHTGCSVKADYFNPDVTPDRSTPVACWLSDVGMVVGRPDGSIAFPQAGRIRMEAGPGRPLFMQQRGIKQSVFCLETLTMGVGGAVDTTI